MFFCIPSLDSDLSFLVSFMGSFLGYLLTNLPKDMAPGIVDSVSDSTLTVSCRIAYLHWRALVVPSTPIMVWILTDLQRPCWSLGLQLMVLLQPLEARPTWRKLGHWILSFEDSLGAPVFSNPCFLFWLKFGNLFPLLCTPLWCSVLPQVQSSGLSSQGWKPEAMNLFSFCFFKGLFICMMFRQHICLFATCVAMPAETRRGPEIPWN